jgi:hypothetical protein
MCPEPLPALYQVKNKRFDYIPFLLAVGLSVLACQAYTYQGLFNVLVSFVFPFGKKIGSLLTFPFWQAGQSWGNAYS